MMKLFRNIHILSRISLSDSAATLLVNIEFSEDHFQRRNNVNSFSRCQVYCVETIDRHIAKEELVYEEVTHNFFSLC